MNERAETEAIMAFAAHTVTLNGRFVMRLEIQFLPSELADVVQDGILGKYLEPSVEELIRCVTEWYEEEKKKEDVVK